MKMSKGKEPSVYFMIVALPPCRVTRRLILIVIQSLESSLFASRLLVSRQCLDLHFRIESFGPCSFSLHQDMDLRLMNVNHVTPS